MLQLLLLVALGRYASGGAIEAPTAVITPAPLVRRETLTVGYRSTGYADGTTLWGTVVNTLDAGQYITTSDSLYRRCASSTTCRFFSCSGGYVVFPTTTSYCGTSIGSTCSYDVSYTDISDTSPKTNYWCDEETLSGWKIFATTPTERRSSSRTPTIPLITTSISSSSSSISSTISSSSSLRLDPSPLSTPLVTSESKSTPVAVIAGSVVGGVAIISIAVAVVVIVLRRKKKVEPPLGAVNAPVYYAPQSPTYQMPVGVPVGGPVYEKTPGMTSANVNPYYINSESGPTSPVPQYSPNNVAIELSSARM